MVARALLVIWKEASYCAILAAFWKFRNTSSSTVQQRCEQLTVLQIMRMIFRGGGGCEVSEGADDGDCGLVYV